MDYTQIFITLITTLGSIVLAFYGYDKKQGKRREKEWKERNEYKTIMEVVQKTLGDVYKDLNVIREDVNLHSAQMSRLSKIIDRNSETLQTVSAKVSYLTDKDDLAEYYADLKDAIDKVFISDYEAHKSNFDKVGLHVFESYIAGGKKLFNKILSYLVFNVRLLDKAVNTFEPSIFMLHFRTECENWIDNLPVEKTFNHYLKENLEDIINNLLSEIVQLDSGNYNGKSRHIFKSIMLKIAKDIVAKNISEFKKNIAIDVTRFL